MNCGRNFVGSSLVIKGVRGGSASGQPPECRVQWYQLATASAQSLSQVNFLAIFTGLADIDWNIPYFRSDRGCQPPTITGANDAL